MNAAKGVAAEAANVWYWANSYKVSITLFALLELGVFEKLTARRSSASALASELELSQEALEPLLNLLSTLGILDHNEDGLTLKPATDALLPLLSLENILSRKHIQRDALIKVLRDGNGKDPMEEAEAQEIWPTFLSAMAVSARALAPHLVRFGSLRSRLRVLDLGGADGTLALSIGRLLPDLEFTIVDRPQVAHAFEKRVAEAGEGSRFRFVVGDLRRPSNFKHEFSKTDTVVLSNVLHLLSTDERITLLQAMRDWMPTGACILAYDQFLAPDMAVDAPLFMVIDWLLCGYRFDITEQDFVDELSQLGFSAINWRRTPDLPGALVCAQVADSTFRRQL